ncbi:hypothetical protein [Streptomyces clavifer]|uniref:LexA family protein n=1 Tax=Streptomyces clavifer TaxID=68188 RepID=UPI00340F7C65
MSRPDVLSDRQAAILRVIQDWITEHGESPTDREIGLIGGYHADESTRAGCSRYGLSNCRASRQPSRRIKWRIAYLKLRPVFL